MHWSLRLLFFCALHKQIVSSSDEMFSAASRIRLGVSGSLSRSGSNDSKSDDSETIAPKKQSRTLPPVQIENSSNRQVIYDCGVIVDSQDNVDNHKKEKNNNVQNHVVQVYVQSAETHVADVNIKKSMTVRYEKSQEYNNDCQQKLIISKKKVSDCCC